MSSSNDLAVLATHHNLCMPLHLWEWHVIRKLYLACHKKSVRLILGSDHRWIITLF